MKGLKTTFDVLAKTRNEASIGVLIPALESPHRWVQEEALTAILKRRNPAGQREVLRRLQTINDHWKEIIRNHSGRMATVLRDAVLGTDEQMCANACQAALWFGEYDLMPALVNAVEDPSNPNAATVAQTIVQLAELLYQELARPRDYQNRRDPQRVRSHVLAALELSVQRFTQHKKVEIIEAFLVLTGRDNATLKQILRNPHHGAYLAIVDTMTHGERGGVIRLLLSFLDDPNAPSSAITVLSHRGDAKFLGYLLGKIGYQPSTNAAQNLKRVESIAWLRDDLSILDQLDDGAQHGAVQMVMASGIKRLEAYRIIEHLLLHGKVGGRRGAIAALEGFHGGEANALALQTLEDPDPQVQAQAVSQLRSRGIPGAMARLIKFVESPHEVVRNSAQGGLGEFSFHRFLASFDILDDEVREGTALLVKKIDPQTIPGLKREMLAPARSRRLRAIEVTLAMNAACELEQSLIKLVEDIDHIVRNDAAHALGICDSEAARKALGSALTDRSPIVRETAKQSLQQLGRTRRAATRAAGEEQDEEPEK